MPAILTGKSKPTINDVARMAGVSKKTVSRVINRSPVRKATREKVERIIAEVGYVPNLQARALALRHNFLISLLHDNPNAQTVLNFQEGVLDSISESEFALVVRPVDRHSPQMLEDIRNFLERQRPYGVLLLPPISENDAVAGLCDEMGCSYVRMGSAALDAPLRLVESNDRAISEEAVGHLIECGHRRIALIAGPEGFRSSLERRAGYLDALMRHGIPVSIELIVQGDYRFKSGKAAAEYLLKLDAPPSAVFASNDEMAIGALQFAKQQGLQIPEDLSLIGFDDTPSAAHIWPPLTTVRWPIRKMGEAAALKLIRPDIAEEQPSRFPSDLIKRESVAIIEATDESSDWLAHVQTMGRPTNKDRTNAGPSQQESADE